MVPTTLIGRRERRSPTTEEPVESWVEATVDRLGSLPRVAVLPLVLVALALPLLGLVLETDSRIESDPVNWAEPVEYSIKNARRLERETGFATTLGVFIETDGAPSNGVFTDQMGAFVVRPRRTGDGRECRARWRVQPSDDCRLAGRGARHHAVASHRSRHAAGIQRRPAALRGLLVADNGNATQVLFQVGPSSLEQRADVLDSMQSRDRIDPATAPLLPARRSATTGGLAVVGVGLLENITANRAQLTIVALLLVAAFVVLRYRDLARGLLTMIPVLARGGDLGSARASARHHPEPAVDRRRTAGRRNMRRVFGPADRPVMPRNATAVSIPN